MKKSKQEILYTIDRALLKALHIAAPICILLLVLAAFNTSWKQIFIYGLIGTAIICGVSILGRICLSPFVKSEEQEEFEQQVDYILSHRKMTKREQTIDEPYTPLANLSPEQESQVIQLLHDLPSNDKNPKAIKLALVAQYLKALENLGKANLTDLYHLRLWVARITEKNVPDSSQFNEAIRACATSKVTKAQKDLERILS